MARNQDDGRAVGIEGVEHPNRRAGPDPKLPHVRMARALDARGVREPETGAALDQSLDHLGDRSPVRDVEVVSPGAKLVRNSTLVCSGAMTTPRYGLPGVEPFLESRR